MRTLWLPIFVVSLGSFGCTHSGKSGTASDRQSTGQAADDGLLIAKGWSDPALNSEPMLAWSLESQATVIAVGKVHEPVERGGRTLLKLELVEVLKGQAAVGEMFPENSQPFMGCNPPESIPTPSESFPPGTKALVYLHQPAGAKALTILQLMPLRDEGHLPQIKKYVELEAALRQKTPDWGALLPPDGIVDRLTLRALDNSRTKNAGPALRAMFESTIADLEGGDSSRASHLGNLVNVLNRQPADETKATLVAFERLLRWFAAIEEDKTFQSFWPVCAPALAQVPTDRVSAWLEILGSVRARSERLNGGAGSGYCLQRVAGCYADLPGGGGVQTLLDALHASVRAGAGKAEWAVHCAGFLANWAQKNPSEKARRKTVGAAAQTLLTSKTIAGAPWLTLRRHLENVVRACR